MSDNVKGVEGVKIVLTTEQQQDSRNHQDEMNDVKVAASCAKFVAEWMEGAVLPDSARGWLEEQGYTDGSIENLRDIGNDEVNALLQHVQNSGEGSEVYRVRAALRGVRYKHSVNYVSKKGPHLGRLKTKHEPHRGSWKSCLCSGGRWDCCGDKDQSSTTCEANPYQEWDCCKDRDTGSTTCQSNLYNVWSCCQSRNGDVNWCCNSEGIALVNAVGIQLNCNGSVVQLKGWSTKLVVAFEEVGGEVSILVKVNNQSKKRMTVNALKRLVEEEVAGKKMADKANAAVAAKMNLSFEDIVSCLRFEVLLHRSNNNNINKKNVENDEHFCLTDWRSFIIVSSSSSHSLLLFFYFFFFSHILIYVFFFFALFNKKKTFCRCLSYLEQIQSKMH